jgi:hypothetical protein
MNLTVVFAATKTTSFQPACAAAGAAPFTDRILNSTS